MKTVAMFGSARPKPETELYYNTVQAARLLASNGWTIATGGGPGLMEAANVGAKLGCEGSTCSLGYSIYLPFESEVNCAVQCNCHHDNFFTRLKQFTDECDAFIALPGGYGTELEILTVVQLLTSTGGSLRGALGGASLSTGHPLASESENKALVRPWKPTSLDKG